MILRYDLKLTLDSGWLQGRFWKMCYFAHSMGFDLKYSDYLRQEVAGINYKKPILLWFKQRTQFSNKVALTKLSIRCTLLKSDHKFWVPWEPEVLNAGEIRPVHNFVADATSDYKVRWDAGPSLPAQGDKS